MRIVGITTSLAALLAAGPAWSHEPYTHWRIPTTGGSCCNNQDCRPVRSRMTDAETWEAWDGRRWLPVPPLSVLKIPSPDGSAHLCEANGAVFCFVPGEVMR